jgi:predicted transcriptional regulator
MIPAPGPQPHQQHYSARRQARLDEETHARLEELATAFHRKLSPALRFVMSWGLTHTQGWTIDQSIAATVPRVPVLLEPDLLQQVQEAAAAHGVTVAAWVRHAMRQVTPDDFPLSWHAVAAQGSRPRSHDSRQYGTRFMLRLDASTRGRLEDLSHHFDRSHAEIIRQLITQAKPGDFPESWQMAAEESRIRRAPPRNSQRATPPGLRRPQTWRKSDA